MSERASEIDNCTDIDRQRQTDIISIAKKYFELINSLRGFGSF